MVIRRHCPGVVALEKTARVRRARATGLSLPSWVLFASSGPLAKAVMSAGWSPTAVTPVRITLAAVLLVPVATMLRPRALRFRLADLWLLLSYGLLGVAGVQLFFFLAVAQVPVGVAMVLVNLAPALVPRWVGKRRFCYTAAQHLYQHKPSGLTRPA